MIERYTTDGTNIYKNGKKMPLSEAVEELNRYEQEEWERFVNNGW